MSEVWNDLGHKPMSLEQKEQAKREYRKLMKQYRARTNKPRNDREVVIKEGRF